MAKNGTRLTAKLSKSLVDKEPRSARSLIPKEENNMPYLTFSFRYCTQQEYFGVKGEDAAWFANLQDRLKDLSGKTGAILESKIERDAYRLHPINWNARNCPIKKEDLLSVPNNIRDNKEEDFFCSSSCRREQDVSSAFLMKQIAFFILCCLTLNIIYSHQKILDML